MNTYFGEVGLTSTSANYICNMAKEFYRHIEAEINNISAFDCEIKIVGETGSSKVSEGNTAEDFNALSEKLNKISQCKSLIAYLREAIKERDKLYRAASEYKDYEARNMLLSPSRPAYLTREEVMNTWSIAELNRYLTLEAKCATFGKYIHENGHLNQLRDSYHETLHSRISVSGHGRDTLVTTSTPTISGEELDTVFFKLQDEYRAAQAELNGMKHQIEEAIEKDKIEKDNQYAKESSEYLQKLNAITEREIAFSHAALAELQKKKIIIPNHLLDIYTEVSNLKNSK